MSIHARVRIHTRVCIDLDRIDLQDQRSASDYIFVNFRRQTHLISLDVSLYIGVRVNPSACIDLDGINLQYVSHCSSLLQCIHESTHVVSLVEVAKVRVHVATDVDFVTVGLHLASG